jgi:hypothetical protein
MNWKLDALTIPRPETIPKDFSLDEALAFTRNRRVLFVGPFPREFGKLYGTEPYSNEWYENYGRLLNIPAWVECGSPELSQRAAKVFGSEMTFDWVPDTKD